MIWPVLFSSRFPFFHPPRRARPWAVTPGNVIQMSCVTGPTGGPLACDRYRREEPLCRNTETPGRRNNGVLRTRSGRKEKHRDGRGRFSAHKLVWRSWSRMQAIFITPVSFRRRSGGTKFPLCCNIPCGFIIIIPCEDLSHALHGYLCCKLWCSRSDVGKLWLCEARGSTLAWDAASRMP